MTQNRGVLQVGGKPDRLTTGTLDALFPDAAADTISIDAAAALPWRIVIIASRGVDLRRLKHKINRRRYGSRYYLAHHGAPRAIVKGLRGFMVLLDDVSPPDVPETPGVAVQYAPPRRVLTEMLRAVSDRPSDPGAVLVAMRRPPE